MAAVVSAPVPQPVSPVAQQPPVAAPPAPTPTPTQAGFGNVSLYVGDLDPTVNEQQLCDLFNQVGQVVSTRVCRDQNRMQSLGYAYVNYGSPQEGTYTIDHSSFLKIIFV